MAVTGKMTVDLYGNTHPFVQSMKAAADAAKKSGSGIAGSIEKINSKQLKSISGNLLGSIGIIGALDAGAKMANELVKGFKDGTLTGLGDAFVHVGNAFAEFAKNLPIAGALGEMIARGIVDPLTGGTMGQESAQEGSRGEFAKKQKEIAELDKGRAMRAAADKELVDRIANESAAKQKKLDEEDAKVKKFYHDQRVSSEQEILKIKDDLRKASMSERDIEFERIQNLKTIPQYLKDEGKAAYDALVALREKQHLEKDIAAENKKSREDSNKQALDGQNDLAEARKAYAETEAELNAQAAGTSNVEGLSTAIGSIKVAGSTDFSIEKQMDIAKQQLNATELHTDILQEIADSLNAMGATT
jgi:hypothetical protein